MKILIVSEMSVPYAVGGGEVRYALLARELACRGHDVTWLSMRQRESPDEEVIDGVRHLHRGPRIAAPPLRSVLAMLRFMLTAFGHIMVCRYDVVDSQTYAPLPAVWLACVLSRQKMVATIHDVSRGKRGQWMSDRFGQLKAWLEMLLYRIPYRRIIAVSESTAGALVSRWCVNRERIHVIPNGIQLPDTLSLRLMERDIDLIFAGRFVPTKNIDDLLEVIRVCHRAGTVKRAILVGDGPLLEEMIARSRSLGLVGVVEFPGRMSNSEVLHLLQRAKLFVHASSREGFPVVMVEALASGVPVVAYSVPGVVDVVESDKTGILVPERDTSAHAAACMHLLGASEQRTDMGFAGRKMVVESLTIQTMADRVLELYRDSVASRRESV
jgi:glycosyltransferase involved in cell wall biosynthesis